MGPMFCPCPSAVADPGSAPSSVYLPGASRPTGGLSAGLSGLTISCFWGAAGPTFLALTSHFDLENGHLSQIVRPGKTFWDLSKCHGQGLVSEAMTGSGSLF